jgi:hypothetical protein
MPIFRDIRYETSGTKNSVSQVFYNNLYADGDPVKTTFSTVFKPKFTTYGGTLNYYGQDSNAIFTNLVRPPIRFVFSANTSSLSGETYFIHNIYRIDFETFRLYGDNQIDNKVNVLNKRTNEAGIALTPKKNKEFINDARVVSGNNPIKEPEKFFGQSLTTNDLNTIQSFFEKPLIIITASTTAITGNIYDLYLDQYIKQQGRFKTELFLDKAQYFIDTKIVSTVSVNKNYADFTQINENGDIVSNLAWNNNIQLTSTNSIPVTINTGLFSGITLSGNYFTYFIVPDKPVFEYPIMTGTLTTFTPEFRWSNGDGADSFLLQVNYNTSDTGFTGTSTFNYPIEKTEKNTKVSRSKTKSFDTEFETEKAIYTFQVPVKSNSTFIYRVANSKELIDIFNVRRNVLTFSDSYTATTQSEPIKIYVVTETDSPFTPGVTGFETPPSLDYESPLASYILSGMVSGSTVTGATIQLTYPNNSFTIGTTDTSGFYSFSGLESGLYTLTTNYRGYSQDVRNITISGNSTLDYEIQISWNNIYDQWAVKENDIIKY